MILSHTRRAGLMALVAVCALTAPLSAATRRRVVLQAAPDELIVITGTVLDSASNAPVFQAQVVNEGRTVTADSQGRYSIKVPLNRNTTLTAQRWGYTAASQTIKVSGTTAIELRLAPKPTITLRESDGSTHILDYETSQFAYLIPFSGYAKFDAGNFCKPDGSKWEPAKDEFKRIIGPAISSTYSACCTLGPVMSLRVEMKSGESTLVYFNDSCFGNEVDFVSRDRTTGQFVYYNFAKIEEIVFP
ncbi:MAG: hypothetical protein JWO97_4633 [Acidobacteria bacterium]|nr:hypothetical protein [Acidobacteriota bacterium]